MPGRADFVVTSPDDRPQLVVEVKRRAGASPEWAATLRRNLTLHGALPVAPYFLLALPDRFYLWKHPPPVEAVLPQYAIDAGTELAPYTTALRTPTEELSEQGFELLVQAWLSDLVAAVAGSREGPSEAAETRAGRSAGERASWLVQSGLAAALHGGRLSTEGAAAG